MTLPLWSSVNSAFPVSLWLAALQHEKAKTVALISKQNKDMSDINLASAFYPLQGILTDCLCYHLIISIIIISLSANKNTTVINVGLGCDSSVQSSYICKC